MKLITKTILLIAVALVIGFEANQITTASQTFAIFRVTIGCAVWLGFLIFGVIVPAMGGQNE